MPNAMGLAGGMPGNAVLVLRVRGSETRARLSSGAALPASLQEAGGTIEVLEPKHPRSPFGPDDIWYHAWQAGGGYGDPLDRDPARVASDVIDRAVSREVARAVYGVVLDDGLTVLADATALRRTKIRTERLGAAPAIAVPEDLTRHADLVTGRDGMICCARCAHAFATPSRSAALDEAAVREAALDLAGPVRGQDHGDRGFRLLLRLCPSCASLFDVSLTYNGDLLVAPPAASAEEVL
jgi:N-methylhydantoinase B